MGSSPSRIESKCPKCPKCPEPDVNYLIYKTLDNLQRDFKPMYDRLPKDTKFFLILRVMDIPDTFPDHDKIGHEVWTSISKNEVYDKVFSKYFDEGTTLQQALNISKNKLETITNEGESESNVKESFKIYRKNNSLLRLIKILGLVVVVAVVVVAVTMVTLSGCKH